MEQTAIGNRQTPMAKGTASQAKVARPATRFHIHKTRAPFLLRCGALLIDYVALVMILVVSTLFARVLGGGARSAGNSAETAGIVIAVIFIVLNFGVLTGWRGQSLGKWATGLRIERADGKPLSFGRAFLRSFVGYPLSLLPLGLGFVVAALNSRGRALHDIIAATVVVREEIVRVQR